jgi:hypothetical protein
VRLGVIPSAFVWEIASSGTWRSLWLRSSCYSWWLPPPRQLGIAQRLWQELVIVLGYLRWSCEGCCAFPGGAPKVILVDCSCHWATSLVVGSYGALGELGCGLPISCRTMRCRSTQRRLASRQAREPQEKFLCSSCDWIDCLPVIDLQLDIYWLVITPTQQYKDHIPIFHIPAN